MQLSEIAPEVLGALFTFVAAFLLVARTLLKQFEPLKSMSDAFDWTSAVASLILSGIGLHAAMSGQIHDVVVTIAMFVLLAVTAVGLMIIAASVPSIVRERKAAAQSPRQPAP